MNTSGRLGIVEAFEAAWQRKATPEEAERLHRVQTVLGVKDNDAILVLMVALEHYQGLYSAMPARIEEAARTAVGEAKETAQRVANTAAQLAHGDLVEQLGEAVNKVATDSARKQQWKALAIGIGAAAITILTTGWLSFSQGKEAGFGAGFKAARHEELSNGLVMALGAAVEVLKGASNDDKVRYAQSYVNRVDRAIQKGQLRLAPHLDPSFANQMTHSAAFIREALETTLRVHDNQVSP